MFGLNRAWIKTTGDRAGLLMSLSIAPGLTPGPERGVSVGGARPNPTEDGE
jgi:hypothetical protein